MSDDLAAAIRAAVQRVLDADGDGYSVAQFAVVMGIERVTADGEIESAPWLWIPPGQPEWMTDGLLINAIDIRSEITED